MGSVCSSRQCGEILSIQHSSTAFLQVKLSFKGGFQHCITSTDQSFLFLYFGARTLITLPLIGQGFPLKEQWHPDGSSIKLPFVAVEIVIVGVVAVTGQLYPLQGRGVVGQLYPRQGRGVVG